MFLVIPFDVLYNMESEKAERFNLQINPLESVMDKEKINIIDPDEEIVTLCAGEEEIDFREIAGICYKGNFYSILQPVVLLEGMSEDEALVFRMSKAEDNSDIFEIELDEEIISAVFLEYEKLLKDTNTEEDDH